MADEADQAQRRVLAEKLGARIARRRTRISYTAALTAAALVIVAIAVMFWQQRQENSDQRKILEKLTESIGKQNRIIERLDDITVQIRTSMQSHRRQSDRSHNIMLRVIRELAQQAGLEVGGLPSAVGRQGGDRSGGKPPGNDRPPPGNGGGGGGDPSPSPSPSPDCVARIEIADQEICVEEPGFVWWLVERVIRLRFAQTF